MFMGPMISNRHRGTRRACPEDAYVQKKRERGCRARVKSQPQIKTRQERRCTARLEGGCVAPDRPVVLGIWREGCDSRMKFSLSLVVLSGGNLLFFMSSVSMCR
jgi:hypothetical protein